jgi:hypothetical protein
VLSEERIEIGRDWFASAELSDTEKRHVLGRSPEQQSANQANFNFICTYLYEEVGLYEEELAEWFRFGMSQLDGERAIDVWRQNDGFEKVYKAAQEWRQQIFEDLSAEERSHEGIAINPTSSEQANMQTVLEIVKQALARCGVKLDSDDSRTRPKRAGIWNANREKPFFVEFIQVSDELEGYKIGMSDDSSSKRLCLLTWEPPGGAREIVHATLGEQLNGEYSACDNIYTSDTDPFPKKADAEPFIQRLKECQKDGTLVPAKG